MVCTIHQFMTGINVQKNANGQWISSGYTGSWLNPTTQIPPDIELAVKDDVFKGRKSFSSQTPAIIGRIVLGANNEFWSVVAVITEYTDETRSFSVYRYFWCEGDNLYLIVGWLKSQGKILTFDPGDVSQPVILHEAVQEAYRKDADRLDTWITQESTLQPFFTQSIPVVTDYNSYNDWHKHLQMINRLATKIAGNKKRLTSWAFQVENLHRPQDFLIIQPASAQAYQSMKSMNFLPTTEVAPRTLEKSLKSVIENLKRDIVTYEVLQELENILSKLNETENSKNSKQILEKIFSDLGAATAIEERMYQSGKMEVVTVRAILIPETLIEYLQYAHLEKKSPNNWPVKFLTFFKGGNSRRTKQEFLSLSIQSKLYKKISNVSSNELPNIVNKLRDGLIIVIEELFNNKISIETAFWLINEDSVWSLGRDQLIKSVQDDIQNILDYIKQNRQSFDDTRLMNKVKELNLEIWFDLIKHYSIEKMQQWGKHPSSRDRLKKYKPLIKLFGKNSKLVFYFSQISGEQIPEKIIKGLRENGHNHVFGLEVPSIYDFRQPGDESSNDLEFIHIIIGIVVIVLGCWCVGGSIERKIIFVLISLVCYALFLSVDIIRNWIKEFAVTLIIIAFIGGNLSSNYLNISNPISPPPQEVITQDFDKNKAIRSFFDKNKTDNAIDKIKENIKNNPDVEKQIKSTGGDSNNIIISALNKVLNLDQNNSYQKIKSSIGNSQKRKQEAHKILAPLVTAIYKYQQKNWENKRLSDQPDGMIDLADLNKYPDSTMAILQQDIIKEITHPQEEDTNSN